MGCLKRIIGIVLTLLGLAGFLFYLPPTLLAYEPIIGSILVNFITGYIPALTNNFHNLAGQALFGLAAPLVMLIISIVILIIGLLVIR